ncbi:MAG: beta-N-acetylhexosaminidase [Spirochaetota bacterium]
MRTIAVVSADTELKKGLSLIADHLPVVFGARANALSVSFKRRAGEGYSVTVDGDDITVNFARTNQAFRALGIIAGYANEGKKPKSFEEKQYFSLINVMLDVSRNAAMTPEKLKELFVRFALMGINSFMLYTEANYEVPGEPMWGYNIGGYSIRELRTLDGWAESLGIEMFPCIQTLAHLRRALQWPQYESVRDTETVLMVGEEKTYELIDKLVGAAMLPYKSKRVHVGMDEAWDLGQGNYLRKNGYKTHFELMRDHLSRVMGIFRSHGTKPMMWSDMFFRAGSKTGAYYDLDVVVPEDVKAVIPSDMQLVYWDYYHADNFYETFIDRHADLNGKKPIIATGAQTWNRFWTHYEYALGTIDPCMTASKKKGVTEAIMTAWGDDGNECDYYSFLPVMQFYADHCFNESVDRAAWQRNMKGSCDIDFNEWKIAGKIDQPSLIETGKWATNVSKFLLWEDPFFGLFQPLFSRSLAPHFASIAEKLSAAMKKKRTYDARLALPQKLAAVLAMKADFPKRLHAAYQAGNKAELRAMVTKEIPMIIRAIESLWKTHRDMWMSTYKPMGWETLDSRYGAVLMRLRTVEDSVRGYLAGDKKTIAELDGKRQKIYSLGKGCLPTVSYANSYTGTCTAVN